MYFADFLFARPFVLESFCNRTKAGILRVYDLDLDESVAIKMCVSLLQTNSHVGR